MTPGASDAGPGYSCATATVDITPDGPVTLAGYSGRAPSSADPHSRLEINVLLLQGPAGAVLLVAIDALFAGPTLTAAAREEAAFHGVNGDAVIVCASHTHFAPATDDGKPLLGEVDPGYIGTTERRLREAIRAVCMARPVPCTVDHCAAETDLTVNRRRRWAWPTLTRSGFSFGGSIAMAPNPSGPRDPGIDVLELRDAAGSTRAVMWKLAAHPVAFPQADRVSSEFPGVVRAALRDRIAPDLPVLFVQGFAGDVRPRIRGSLSVRDRLTCIRRGPAFGRAGMAEWRQWSASVAESVIRAMDDGRRYRCEPALQVGLARLPLESIHALVPGDDGHRTLDVHAVRLDTRIGLLFISAEVCAPFGSSLPPGWIGCAYTGDVFGYLPTERQVAEGGYEASGFVGAFGLRGDFETGFEQRVRATIATLVASGRA